MNHSLSPPLTAALNPGVWMLDRLAEARGILADVPEHPETLVILAARVVAGQTESASECAAAINLLRKLDRRPLPAIAAASFQNGGAA